MIYKQFFIKIFDKVLLHAAVRNAIRLTELSTKGKGFAQHYPED